MSFGNGPDGFISLLDLVKDTRKRFVYAPVHFKGVYESIKCLSNVLRDIDDIEPENVLSDAQKQKLADIAQACCRVLRDLNDGLNKYLDLSPKADESLMAFSRRFWLRLKWDPEEIQRFEQRIHQQVDIFNTLLGKLIIPVNPPLHETSSTSPTGHFDVIQDYHTEEEYEKILHWISPVNYVAQQKDYLSQQQEGSGQWFLQAMQFRSWLEGNGETLFCPGIPGSGKTIMVSIIVNFLEQEFGHLGSFSIAYIYCNSRQREEQSFCDILASLVRQLAQERFTIPRCVREAYVQAKKRKARPEVSQLRECLHSMCAQLSTVYIVVDALDECDTTAQDRLLQEINSLQDGCDVHFLATSRYIPDIISKFEGRPSLEIHASMEDIWRYLHSQLFTLPSFVLRNKELQYDIVTGISNAAGGMFLLAKLHLDSLVGKRSQKTLQTALKNLSTGARAYESAYKAAMERIEGQVPDQREMAMQALSWIIYAKTPLTTRELQHALAIEIGQQHLDEANIPDVEDIVSICAGLVVVDEQRNIIRLIHHTAQEYFEQTWIKWFPEVQENIAAACITYLAYECFEEYSCELDGDTQPTSKYDELLEKYPLYHYAAQNWARHGRVDQLGENLVMSFLGYKRKVSCSAQVTLKAKDWPAPRELTGLHLASYLGLEHIISVLVQREYTVDIEDFSGRTPLSWAAGEGHASVVHALLQLGADQDQLDTNLETPLSWAAKAGHANVVEQLLKRDVNKDCANKDGQTPLSLAAKYGHWTVVELLLESGVNEEVKDNNGRTVLSWAANQYHLDIVKLLLGKEADAAPESHQTGSCPEGSILDSEALSKLLDSPTLGPGCQPPRSILKRLLEMGVEPEKEPLFGPGGDMEYWKRDKEVAKYVVGKALERTEGDMDIMSVEWLQAQAVTQTMYWIPLKRGRLFVRVDAKARVYKFLP